MTFTPDKDYKYIRFANEEMNTTLQISRMSKISYIENAININESSIKKTGEELHIAVKDLCGPPVLEVLVEKDVIVSGSFEFVENESYIITSNGNVVNIVLYNTEVYNPENSENIIVVRDYKDGNFSTIMSVPKGYNKYRFYGGTVDSKFEIYKVRGIIKDTELPYFGDYYSHGNDCVLGKLNENGILTNLGETRFYVSNFIEISGSTTATFSNESGLSDKEYWIRAFFYSDDNETTFISRSEAFNMLNSNEISFDIPTGAKYIRFFFAYVDSKKWFTPFDIIFGSVPERTYFEYGKSIITIAGKYSTSHDKFTADVVCDGVHDEVEIQKAINYLQSRNGGKIILLPSVYIIDSLYDSGVEEIGKLGLYLKTDSEWSKYGSITIEGITMPNLNARYTTGSCAVIQLSDACFESLNDTEKVSIIGGLPYINSLGEKEHKLTAGSWHIENIGIAIQELTKSVIGINAEYCWSLQLVNIQCARTENVSTDKMVDDVINANDNCIGIRTLGGWNNGSGYELRHVNVRGWGTAFDMSGEHLFMTGCCARINKTGFRFGYFGNDNHFAHPNTLINCADESCMYGIRLYRGNLHPVLDIIDYNKEVNGIHPVDNPEKKIPIIGFAWEEIPGNYYGRVTYAVNGDVNYGYANTNGYKFWDDGSGLNFVTVNIMDKTTGTTQERPKCPQRNQQYFDTTINKLILYINGKWVDTDGNDIT